MRIGVLGGTFDPPHVGHLEFARAAIRSLDLDEVIFLPANRNPLKRTICSPSKVRLAMVELMLEGESKMAVSDIEVNRGGPSYAVDTVAELQHVHPGDYWFLVGADALKDLDRWKNPARLLKLCRLGVAIRPPTTESEVLGRLSPETRNRVDVVPMKRVDISATELRDRFSKRGLVAPFVDPAVLKYINQNHLYGS